MRPASSLATLSLALAAGILVGGGARAQSGWVDPPTRPAVSARPAESRPEPAAPAAPSPAPQARSTPTEAETAAEPAPERSGARASRGARHAERPERRMDRHHRQRRLADTPPVQSAPVPPVAARPEPRLSDWAGTAQGLVSDYFDAVSAPGPTIVASAPRFYGEQVRFHGRTVGLRAMMAEKRDFARRWPERRYEPRGMRTFCNGALATCVVRAEVAFRAASPSRGALSQGIAEVVMEVSLAGPRPVIVSETSRVLHRGAASAGAAGTDRST